MDIRKLKKLIELVEASSLSEVEIRDDEGHIRIVRGGNAPIYLPAQPMTPALASPNAGLPAPVSGEASTAPAEPAGVAVRSPMVGTFYRAAAPGAAAFVEVGQTVKVGQVICIIEAMKMFNQIESEIAGTVRAIVVENGQPVEFDQPLVLIDPA